MRKRPVRRRYIQTTLQGSNRRGIISSLENITRWFQMCSVASPVKSLSGKKLKLSKEINGLDYKVQYFPRTGVKVHNTLRWKNYLRNAGWYSNRSCCCAQCLRYIVYQSFHLNQEGGFLYLNWNYIYRFSGFPGYMQLEFISDQPCTHLPFSLQPQLFPLSLTTTLLE